MLESVPEYLGAIRQRGVGKSRAEARIIRHTAMYLSLDVHTTGPSRDAEPSSGGPLKAQLPNSIPIAVLQNLVLPTQVPLPANRETKAARDSSARI